MLRQLAGDWTGKAKHGPEEHDATLSYKVTVGCGLMGSLGSAQPLHFLGR
jgi:hypothetical protein